MATHLLLALQVDIILGDRVEEASAVDRDDNGTIMGVEFGRNAGVDELLGLVDAIQCLDRDGERRVRQEPDAYESGAECPVLILHVSSDPADAAHICAWLFRCAFVLEGRHRSLDGELERLVELVHCLTSALSKARLTLCMSSTTAASPAFSLLEDTVGRASALSEPFVPHLQWLVCCVQRTTLTRHREGCRMRRPGVSWNTLKSLRSIRW
jgi:hypothetical protein